VEPDSPAGAGAREGELPEPAQEPRHRFAERWHEMHVDDDDRVRTILSPRRLLFVRVPLGLAGGVLGWLTIAASDATPLKRLGYAALSLLVFLLMWGYGKLVARISPALITEDSSMRR
jgi:hypothetical protein